jgi:hypothetical protein
LGVAAVGLDLAERGHIFRWFREGTGREARPTLTINERFRVAEGGWVEVVRNAGLRSFLFV